MGNICHWVHNNEVKKTRYFVSLYRLLVLLSITCSTDNRNNATTIIDGWVTICFRYMVIHYNLSNEIYQVMLAGVMSG